MTLQTVKLAGRRFVIVPEKDFRRLQQKAEDLDAQDRGDIAESLRRLRDPRQRPIPYEQVRRELGLR